MRERFEKGRFMVTAWGGMILLSISLITGFSVLMRDLWNGAFHSHGFGEITTSNALLLFFSIISFRIDYWKRLQEYHQLFLSKLKTDIFAQLCTALLGGIVTIVVTVTVRYSWNSILPQLLRLDLMQISIWESAIFVIFFQLLLTAKGEEEEEEEEEEKISPEPKEMNAEEVDEILRIVDLEDD